MKSSNLALRMPAGADAGEAPQATEQAAVTRKSRESRRRAGFDYRAFEQRVIVIRDSGLRPFRLR